MTAMQIVLVVTAILLVSIPTVGILGCILINAWWAQKRKYLGLISEAALKALEAANAKLSELQKERESK